MKIGFVDVTITTSYGGIQTAVWELAKALANLGHEIFLYGGAGDIRHDIKNYQITVRTFPYTPREKVVNIGRRFQRIVERLSMATHARKTIAEDDLDWLILTKPFDFFWPLLIPGSCKTRFCYMSGGTSFFKLDRWLSKRIDAWVSCSEFNAWQIQHHFKHFPHVIYNGVDINKFTPDSGNVRQKLNINDDHFLLVFAGRLVGWKGLSYVLKSLALIQDERVRFLIIGSGEERENLQVQSQMLGVDKQVIFHDPIEHSSLPAFYSSGDAGIFPSTGDEAFGITIAEAMACGLPVIGSYIGGIPEVIGNEGSAGLLVSPGHPEAIANAIRLLMGDREKRCLMGHNARQRITNLYTWQHSAQRLLSVLKK
ncbi:MULTISPECIES: glycosyltransferase family 4 protein [Mangrovibacter]|uniref:Glycosyltransferase involved in cell wall biosynthesis n=1 Tax=Mangrovibacter plantisponsor TaxID=451513 RepID=A0A317PTV0_9ENTR|nr:glycosyltransferase family 4 protein [Mangrovibacter plantisponsor]PWW05359.1 glycosyltransferase involved in cell wall biosynthesis [Mangrovibacter plantisponsor]